MRHQVTLLLAAMALTASAQIKISTPTAHADFEKRVTTVDDKATFAVFDRNLTPRQREAMEFLYAYMPLPDLADYTADFYLENVDYALRARDEMPWGNTVPMREWQHFVLPVRINNENLDHSRKVFYDELAGQIKDMSMSDAVLFINHWCHERVTYQPSDSRTSSPLSTIKSAYGRCGEESTFTVAALRAMGIPARQVYTPRWAHTDDNHAWVEAWVDGQWHFLGACEPEPVLDLAWFNVPASRGMLMNTLTFGRYDGPEQRLAQSSCYTEINVTANYAPVDSISVTVVDRDGNPTPDARVDYRLYNYAEFYPIASRRTDSQGRSQLTAGLGDIIVWASKEGRYGFAKCHVGNDREVTVSLNYDKTTLPQPADINITPPAQTAELPQIPEELSAANNIMKAREDSIRTAYMSTFFTHDRGTALGRCLGLDPDAVAAVMTGTSGNHDVVEKFLKSVPEASRERALRLMQVISDKDRRDVPGNVLADHFNHTPETATPLYDQYVLNPRIANEMLTPYKGFFIQQIPAEKRREYRNDPRKWVTWCADSITIDNWNWNPQYLCMSPASVWRLRTTDNRSRNIFFVAGARSMGIAARIDPVTEKTQYADRNGNWVDADFNEPLDEISSPKGRVKLDYNASEHITDPVYYTHFTLSRIDNGVPVLLNYPENATWSDLFADTVSLDAGQYMITSGQRLADGGVLARVEFFDVAPEHIANPQLTMRHDESRVQVIGSFNSENLYHDLATGTDRSLLSTTGRGYYVLGLLSPNHEPTVHALNDMIARRQELEAWGGAIMLIADDSDAAARLNLARFTGLPSTVTAGTDINGTIANEISENLGITPKNRPIFIIADTFNRVVFVSQGYTIGLGNQIIDTMTRIGRN